MRKCQFNPDFGNFWDLTLFGDLIRAVMLKHGPGK